LATTARQTPWYRDSILSPKAMQWRPATSPAILINPLSDYFAADCAGSGVSARRPEVFRRDYGDLLDEYVLLSERVDEFTLDGPGLMLVNKTADHDRDRWHVRSDSYCNRPRG